MKLPRFSTPADRLQQWHGENWHTAKGRLVRDVLYSVDSGLVTTVSFLAGISLSLVRRIAADTSRWLRFMVQEEIGISPSSIDNPWEIGFVSAGAFLLGALPAVLPFLVLPSVATALWVSAALVLAFLFGIGIVSTRVTKANWLAGGLETLLFGALACGAGFLLGRVALRYLS